MNLDNTECDFLRFMKRACKGSVEHEIVYHDTFLDSDIKDPVMYRAVALRTMVCELFYHAIQMFPDITDYFIKFQNNKEHGCIHIAYFDEVDISGNPAMVKVVSSKYGTHLLDRPDILTLYMTSKIPDPDFKVIDTIINMMWNEGHEPDVTTSFNINKKIINQFSTKR